MRRFQSHKIVEADEITDIVNTMATKAIVTEGTSAMEAERHEVPDNFFGRGTPQIGDYLVLYDDGHISWSPKAAFESGYTLINLPLDHPAVVTVPGADGMVDHFEVDPSKLGGLRMRRKPLPDDVSANSVEQVEIEIPDGIALRSVDHPSPDAANEKLVRFLVARIAKFEEGYDSTDAARMEELSWLLLQAVGGNIL